MAEMSPVLGNGEVSAQFRLDSRVLTLDKP